MDIGPAEIMIFVLVVVLLFGAKKLPELARSLGVAKKEFTNALKDDEPASSPTPSGATAVTPTAVTPTAVTPTAVTPTAVTPAAVTPTPVTPTPTPTPTDLP